MAKMMKAPWSGRSASLDHRGGSDPHAKAGRGPGQGDRHRGLPYRPPCRGRRLAAPPLPSFPVMRGRACCGRGPGRQRAKGGRRGRHRLAARRLRSMRVLHDRVGQSLSAPAQQRLHGGWQLRRVCDRKCGLCRPLAAQDRFCRNGAHPLRRCHHLQGHQGDRSEARRVDRNLRDRRARPGRRSVRQGDGPACRRPRRDRGQAGTGSSVGGRRGGECQVA